MGAVWRAPASASHCCGTTFLSTCRPRENHTPFTPTEYGESVLILAPVSNPLSHRLLCRSSSRQILAMIRDSRTSTRNHY